MDKIEDIVERIYSLAAENSMTSKEIGKIIGTKKGPMTDWKNGKSKPTLDQIIAICEYFGVSADYLIFGMHEKALDRSFSSLSSEEIEVIEEWRKLSYSNRVIAKGRLFELSKEQIDSSKNFNFEEKVAE